ncbi:hypothetical protein [Oceanobacillus sp. CF4.6]|uniref:hypothetical protein n=1 Tax=Oceanobacillus sp. CF4.6 TaxID=3373080 RepID=UPI003EE626B9
MTDFLLADKERAEKEIDCFECCTEQADSNFEIGNYAVAAAYYENATRSLKELARMQEEKKLYDKAWFLLKQIEGQQQVNKTIAAMRLGI